MLNKYLPAFLKAIMAGIMISIGACAYLGLENHTLGAMLFTIGLFTIYSLDFYLFTGKVGYLVDDPNIKQIIVIWCGNFVGTFISAKAVLLTRMVETTEILENVTHYAEVKLTDGYVSIFILGILCGIMMYIAAQSFKTAHDTNNSVGGYVGLFLCVMIFLLLGFEHSIANIFYFTLADVWSVHALIALIVVSFGNAVGGMLFKLIALPINNHH
ncbi:formate/nitrite transporter family protein [Tannockella kyphosi]|uniref:formate/nitrite transporter family protein n=1 Tax=Tannockella kyphosi TaxID=2899121 RepID=UPI002012F08C|nr:formate/nitrite transporter family protein [Tannockella kyphosi]